MKKLLTIGLLTLMSLPALANDGCVPPKGYTFAPDTECDPESPLFPVVKIAPVGYADHQGNVVITPAFEEGYDFVDNLALVKHKGKWGYINLKGKFAIPATFDDAWAFDEGLARIQDKNKFGFINTQGKVVIPAIYDDSSYFFYEGLAHAKKGEKWGYIDKQGKTAIAFGYDYAEEFSEGLAVVGKITGKDSDGEPIYKYGYIDKKGKVVIALTYDDANAFEDGVANVSKGDDDFYINKQGKKVKNPYE